VSAPVVLILGGTGEARALAAELDSLGVPVISSLAGRVTDPVLPAGAVRIGGFGGADGLTEYLRRHRIRAVVDATHPFAATISASAGRACAAAGVPLLRLARPGWAEHPLAGIWRWVDDYAGAVAAARGGRVLLTTGRNTLTAFAALAAPFVLVRLVQPAAGPLPPGWSVVTSRGPYTAEGEVALMREHRIDVLVTKDSGGAMTEPKLVAADELGVRVVIVRRPLAVAGIPSVDNVAGAAGWARAQSSGLS
jgi:precorrin-6A/cobalt-precorrin-6A reductase